MSAPLEVFCCYAREDQEMLTYLRKHLAPLERQGQITIWSDTNLNAGVEWEKELHQHLESADIVLLLISPDFMASDYCYSTEMARAIARHNEGSAQVIPILLRATFWQNAPFAKLQIIPTNAKPITSWPDRDDAFHDVTIQVNQVVSKLQTRRAPIQVNGPNGERQQRVALQSEPAPDMIPAFDPAKLTLRHTLTGHTDVVWRVTFSLDGHTLTSVSHDRTIKLWKLSSGQELRTLTVPSSDAWCVASPDGQTLASSSQDNTIRLWEAASGQELCTLTGHRNIVWHVAISPDNKTLASGSADMTIKLWKLPSGRELHTLTGHTSAVYSVTISPDGQTLASGSYDGTIKLWKLPSGRELHTLTGHTKTVHSVAISPDNKTLASGSYDGTIKLWELSSGQELCTLTGHRYGVWSVGFSPDGTTLASGSADTTVKLWGMEP